MTNFIWMCFLALLMIKTRKMLLDSVYLSVTSSARASSSANLRMTTKRSMVDGGGEAGEPEMIKPPLQSSVWKHFSFCKDGVVLNKLLPVCRICKGKVKYHGKTTNLSNHLLRRYGISHNANHPGTSCSIPAAAAVQGNVNSAEASGLASTFSQRLGRNSARVKNITATIAKFICKDMQPYSVVENPGFCEMIQTLEPRYQTPSRPHFSEKVIPALYESTKNDVKLSLSQAE